MSHTIDDVFLHGRLLGSPDPNVDLHAVFRSTRLGQVILPESEDCGTTWEKRGQKWTECM